MHPRPFGRSFLALPVLAALVATPGAQGPQTPDPGTVFVHQYITGGKAGFTAELNPFDSFGHSIAPLGDLDGDGVRDLLVGCPNFLEEPIYRGISLSCVYVLFLHPDGTVKHHTRIAEELGGFQGDLATLGHFGSAVASIGDTDGDLVPDIVVGEQSGHGAADFLGVGAVWLMHLFPDGRVKGPPRKISAGLANFPEPLRRGDNFGVAIAAVGDLDGNGMTDIAVGANGDDGPLLGQQHANFGAVYILFLEPNGLVMHHVKIGMGGGLGLPIPLSPGDFFGTSIAALPDFDGNGVAELLVGAPGDDDGGPNRGAAYRLGLMPDGTVHAIAKVSSSFGALPTPLSDHDNFGRAVSNIGDLDGDGAPQYVIGAPGQDVLGGENQGSVHVLFLDPLGDVSEEQEINIAEGDFTPEPDETKLRATALAVVGDVNGDGADELAVGSVPTAPNGPDHGAVFILLLNAATVVPPTPLVDCGLQRPSVLRVNATSSERVQVTLEPNARAAQRALPEFALPLLFVAAPGSSGGDPFDPCAPLPPRAPLTSFANAGALDIDLPQVPSLTGRSFDIGGGWVGPVSVGPADSVSIGG